MLAAAAGGNAIRPFRVNVPEELFSREIRAAFRSLRNLPAH
jgi:hypothetical protein